MTLSGKGRREKGGKGEREFLNHLGQLLGMDLCRNLQQTRDGGADCVSLPGIALEIKRRESLSIGQWWSQATEQAAAVNAVPVLAYRQSRKPWSVVVPLSWISPGYDGIETATICLEAFAKLVGRGQ